MNLTMTRKHIKQLVDVYGWSGFLQILNEFYSGFNFYTVSKAWYDDKNYICKAKGQHGDLIINWEVEA